MHRNPLAANDGARSNIAMFAEAAKSTFELTPDIMWLPLTVVLAPPVLVLIWYFLNERRLRRKRERDSLSR